ncbi:hypothetical protein E4N62_31290 [Streptomyces sp. MNU76]|uniref:hypothetical protein n=1 Tax=Streptomyces sp. MNU76 TaxID=2560026 RepID=UPI001E42AD58|nr:hypothetical protein [Streptomyces sp. MNU76]MCC9709341.1 hypothetical protein [Streptomyces sp. MNU76]
MEQVAGAGERREQDHAEQIETGEQHEGAQCAQGRAHWAVFPHGKIANDEHVYGE